MPLIEASGLAKRYGRKRVFEGVDLAADAGEIVAILGVNGVGKTTLLGCLYGVLGWSAGIVTIDGHKLDRADLEMRRRMIFLPHDGLFFEGADVLRNAAVFSETWRGVDAPPPLDLEEWIERFGLLNVAFDPIEQLSRGQRYKAGLLALHCADPEIWLIDEPFATGMDARGMEAFRQMARAAAERGRCIIYTTQFPELAARFATRVVVLGDGGVKLDEPADSRDPEAMIARLGQHLGIDAAMP